MTDSLHREYAPWLKVLQHFCDSTVVSEFNALKRSGTGKETKLLDCLKSVVHSISTTHELNKEGLLIIYFVTRFVVFSPGKKICIF